MDGQCALGVITEGPQEGPVGKKYLRLQSVESTVLPQLIELSLLLLLFFGRLRHSLSQIREGSLHRFVKVTILR